MTIYQLAFDFDFVLPYLALVVGYIDVRGYVQNKNTCFGRPIKPRRVHVKPYTKTVLVKKVPFRH